MALLDTLNGPEDLKRIPREQLPELAQEVRERLIDCVSVTGGHIGASLGVVELAIALLYEFDSPTDKILWDVGHQAYAWKLLTGRNAEFPTLRQTGGISGFLKRSENEHDHFGAGHAGTAMSAALGHGDRARPPRRRQQGRGGRGGRRADLRALVRGDEQRRPLGYRHHPDRQRQRDEHLAQRGRHQPDAGRDRRQSTHQQGPGAGEGSDRRRLAGVRRPGRGLRQEPRGERQEPLLRRDVLRGDGVPVLRSHRRARPEEADRDAAVRPRAQGPARDPRPDREGQGLHARRGEPREVARPRRVRSDHGRGAQADQRSARLDQGVRRRARRTGPGIPGLRGHHRGHAERYRHQHLPEGVAGSVLRRRDRRRTCRHLRGRARHAGDPAGGGHLQHLPAARLRQHHPRHRGAASAGGVLHGPGGARRRGRADAHGAVRHRLHAGRARHDGDRAEGRR